MAHRVVHSPQATSWQCPHLASSHATSDTMSRSILCGAHSASSRRARSPPLRAMPRPSPRRGVPLSPFPTTRSWPLSTPAPPRHSTLARDITRSGVARPRVSFSSYTSSSFPFSDVASVCFKCFRYFRSICCKYFICMLQK
jgi:hypothetical protein